MCCGPWGRKESDTVERLNNNTYVILLSTQDRNTQKVWKIQAKKNPRPSAYTSPAVITLVCSLLERSSVSALFSYLAAETGVLLFFRMVTPSEGTGPKLSRSSCHSVLGVAGLHPPYGRGAPAWTTEGTCPASHGNA